MINSTILCVEDCFDKENVDVLDELLLSRSTVDRHVNKTGADNEQDHIKNSKEFQCIKFDGRGVCILKFPLKLCDLIIYYL